MPFAFHVSNLSSIIVILRPLMDTEHLCTFYPHSYIETLDVSPIIPMSSEYPIQHLIGSVNGIFYRLGITLGIYPVILE
jgi:hypothetical protein